jgi:hypothetical protein
MLGRFDDDADPLRALPAGRRTVMIDERIAERRRQVRGERRRGRLRRTVIVVGLLVLAVALVLVERSALVGLEEVEVTGPSASIPPRSSTRPTSRSGPRPCGCGSGRSRSGSRRSRSSVTATARRSIRSRCASRSPNGSRCSTWWPAGQAVLVDRDGVVLAEGRSTGCPRSASEDEPPAPGEEVDADPGARQRPRHLAVPVRSAACRGRALRGRRAGRAHAGAALGVEVRFGRADRVDEKVRALGAVLDDVGVADVAVIDVRACARRPGGGRTLRGSSSDAVVVGR